jgi:hypothetical protein
MMVGNVLAFFSGQKINILKLIPNLAVVQKLFGRSAVTARA